MIQLNELETEKRNPHTIHIDRMSTEDILLTINREDQQVAEAVNAVIPQLVILVDETAERLRNGGRLIYMGAGTSGRLGILDASECPPTFGVSAKTVHGVIAGGNAALTTSSEGTEDDEEAGIRDLKGLKLCSRDVLVGIAASGRTPYVIGGLQYANSVGAYTGSLCCVSSGIISGYAASPLEAVTGPEVITGSTRMKAGTAQKLILNMLSTAVMIKLGKVYENLMVDVKPANEKLITRSRHMIALCTSCSEEQAAVLLEQSRNNVKTAICMGLTGLNREECHKLLAAHQEQLAGVMAGSQNY